MGNGGSLPAHLPSSLLSNPEAIIDRYIDNFRQSFNDCQKAFHEELRRAISLAAQEWAMQEWAKAADDHRRQEAAAEALAA